MGMHIAIRGAGAHARTKLYDITCWVLACALAMMLCAAAMFPNVAAADSLARNTYTTIAETDDYTSSSATVTMCQSNLSYTWGAGALYARDSAGSIDGYGTTTADVDGSSVQLLYIDKTDDSALVVGGSTGAVLELTFSEAFSVGEQAYDVVVTVNKVKFFANTSSSDACGADGHCVSICTITKSHFQYGAAKKSGYYYAAGTKLWTETAIVEAGTDTVVDPQSLNLFMCASDLDIVKEWDGTSTSETTGFASDEFDDFTVFENCELYCSTDSAGYVEFCPGDETLQDDGETNGVEGDDSYWDAAVYATVTSSSTFATTWTGATCATRYELYCSWTLIDDPVKTVSSSTLERGEAFTFSIEQTMPKLGKDTFSTFSSFSFVDTLPEGTTYAGTYQVLHYDETEQAYVDESSCFEASVQEDDEGRDVVVVAANSTWLEDTGNYDGQIVELVLSCTIDDDATATTYTNEADVYINESYTTCACDYRVLAPAIDIEKTVERELYQIGEEIVWSVVVSSTGEGTAHDVAVSDELPAGLTLCDAPDVELAGGAQDAVAEGEQGDAAWSVSVATMPAGSSVTVTFRTLAAQSLAGETLENTAVASATLLDEVSASATTYIAAPQLALVKTCDADEVEVGDTFSWTVEATQTDELAVAKNVTVRDTLPDELSLAGTPTCTVSYADGTQEELDVEVDGDEWAVSIASLAYGDVAVVSFETLAVTASSEPVVNTATVSADYLDDVEASDEVGITASYAMPVTGSPARMLFMLAGLAVLALAGLLALRLAFRRLGNTGAHSC